MTYQTRCEWCGTDPLYMRYHDEEWGVPVYDDQKLFEFLTLESAQAGLSWITILRKRENYRQAFENFDPKRVARFNEERVKELLSNAGIIRNRLKINAAIHNAKRFLEIQNEFGSFSDYSWQFVEGKPIVGNWKKPSELPSTSKESIIFSQDLKRRGFQFLGPTTVYAHMQACGMVNDHLLECFRHPRMAQQQKNLAEL